MTTRWPERTIRTVLAHHPNAEAGRILGVSRERARQLRDQYNIPTPPPPTRRRDRRVAALIARGVPTQKVAEAVGVDPSTVRRIAHRMGATPPRTPPPCGTRAGYLRHLRRGERACEPCLQANREAARKQASERTAEPDIPAALPSTP